MTLGPFVTREFRLISRRRSLYFGRAASAGLVLALLACMALGWDHEGWDRSSIRGRADFTLVTFGAVVLVQAAAVWMALPSIVAPRIAGERERKTLDTLLASRFSSAEIVLGLMAEGAVRSLSGLVAVLPILLVMIPFGGVDPRLVLLALGGLLSTTFVGAALAIAVSAGARDRRVALGRALGLSAAWMTFPFLAVLTLPSLWPAGSRWLMPIAVVGLESNPAGVAASLTGLAPGVGAAEAILRMIGLQVVGGILLLIWAIARLRPASRGSYDVESGTHWLLRKDRSRRKPWPACGDDPVFWRERYSRTPSTRLGRVVRFGQIAGLVLAIYAFPGLTFRLREFTILWEMFYLLNLAEIAAAGIARERIQDTWSGLLATSLTGAEIIGAKPRAAVWKTRGWAAVLVVLWTVGLLNARIHPLGYAAAMAGLVVSTWFVAALGTYIALRTPNANEAGSQASLIVFILVTSAMVTSADLGTLRVSVLMGAASPPFCAGLALLSYEDVGEAIHSGGFPALKLMGIHTGEGAWVVLATCLLGLIGQAIGAAFFTAAAIDDFDELVGRPCRPAGTPCHRPVRWR